MGNFLRLVNGVPRSFAEAGSTSIYDQTVLLVASSPGAGEILGPVGAGTPITLPSSQTYDAGELEVYLNSARLEVVLDYTHVGSIPRTQISLTFDLVVGDRIRFRIDRAP